MTQRAKSSAGLLLGALGVVFGDIGTSPLYALQAIFSPLGLHMQITEQTVIGIISMIIWAIILVVTVRYVWFIMRVSNHGEGGILALVAIIRGSGLKRRYRHLFIGLGLVGVALFYGDSTITPAISVLSAVEGLKTISPSLDQVIIPATLILLTALFWFQHFGTGAIGRVFGPIMLLWFTTIGVAGLVQISSHPSILQAMSPLSATGLILSHPALAFVALGAVILAVTGAEALYADMGHFGRTPIARAWLCLVLPALACCYLGQGAVLLHDPTAGTSPFMSLFPAAIRVPVVLLATAATLIASQSVISGAFSLTKQAMQLDFLPRMRLRHTSVRETGQIYLPFVNTVIFLIVATLVVTFGSSERLASAYGIAVSGTLAIDSILFLVVARVCWRQPWQYVAIGLVCFSCIDIGFISGNLAKLLHGGWFPVTLSTLIFICMYTWHRGQSIIKRERKQIEGPLPDFVDKIRKLKPPLPRVAGTAVFIGHHTGLAPLALHAAVEKFHELQEKAVVVTVHLSTAAHIPAEHRATFDPLKYDDGISLLRLSYGFHDVPDIPKTLESLRSLSTELDFDPKQASYFVSLGKILPTGHHHMPRWQKSLYSTMARNAVSASDYYKLPVKNTEEMRTIIEL